MIQDLVERSKQQGLGLEITHRVKLRLVEEGYNPAYGARPLRRAVMRLIEDKIASKFLQESPEGKANIFIDLDDDGEIEVRLFPIELSQASSETDTEDTSLSSVF